MNSNCHSSKHQYGLNQTGEGSGNYTPELSVNVTETTLLADAVKKVKLYLKAMDIPFEIIKFHGGSFQRSGLPDLLIMLPKGKVLWVEFKRPGADTTALQKNFLEKGKQLGYYVGTAESADTLERMVSEVILYENLLKPGREEHSL